MTDPAGGRRRAFAEGCIPGDGTGNDPRGPEAVPRDADCGSVITADRLMQHKRRDRRQAGLALLSTVVFAVD